MRSLYKTITLVIVLLISTTMFAQQVNDQQLKTNVTSISNPLQQLSALQPRSFTYNTGAFRQLSLPNGVQYGFMAEEFKEVFPQFVYKKNFSVMAGKNNYRNASRYTIDTEALIPVLVAAIQEQQSQINVLKEEIKSLRK